MCMFKKRRKKVEFHFDLFKPEENLSTKVALVTNGPVSNLAGHREIPKKIL